MVALPVQVTTATITADLTSAIVDTSGTGLVPAGAPLAGQVTFTPDRVGGQLLVPTATPPLMVTVKAMPFTLDGTGSLLAKLVVIPGATYTVSFNVGVPIASFSIGPLVAGQTYDLSSLAPVTAMNGIAYVLSPATDSSIATAVSTAGTATRTALNAAFAALASLASDTPAMSGNYISGVAASVGSVLPGNGVLYLIPVNVDRNLTIDQLAINVTVAGGGGSLCRLGIYQDASSLPGTLLLDAGTVGTATIGLKTITVSQSLTPGRYWFAAVQQGAPTPAATYTTFTGASGAVPASNITSVISGRYAVSITAALPAVATLNAADGSVILRVMGRVV
jgi:hypothetical protein